MNLTEFNKLYMNSRNARHYFHPPIAHTDGRPFCKHRTKTDCVLTYLERRSEWIVANMTHTLSAPTLEEVVQAMRH